MKTEIWNNNPIRFVEVNGEWWAIANDVCNALAIKNTRYALRTLKGVVKYDTLTDGGMQQVNIIDEKNIYRLVFKSRKKEAEEFQDFVFDVIKKLREESGLEGFQVFRMLDKKHQLSQQALIDENIKKTRKPKREDFIKLNTIANKVISTIHGLPKMIKKGEMTPQMLVERQMILEDTAQLISAKERFNLSISVSETVQKKWN